MSNKTWGLLSFHHSNGYIGFHCDSEDTGYFKVNPSHGYRGMITVPLSADWSHVMEEVLSSAKTGEEFDDLVEILGHIDEKVYSLSLEFFRLKVLTHENTVKLSISDQERMDELASLLFVDWYSAGIEGVQKDLFSLREGRNIQDLGLSSLRLEVQTKANATANMVRVEKLKATKKTEDLKQRCFRAVVEGQTIDFVTSRGWLKLRYENEMFVLSNGLEFSSFGELYTKGHGVV